MSRWAPMSAAVVATAGDLMLLRFVAERAGGGSPSLAWVVAGGVLGVLAIPLYGLGYRLVVPTLRRWSASGARVLGALGTAIGLAWATVHGLSAWQIAADARSGAPALDALAAVASWSAPVLAAWTIGGVLWIAASVLVVWGGARLGIWALVVASPVVADLLLSAAGAVSPAGRAYLVPAAPNLAHVIFFAVAAVASTRRLGRRAASLNVSLASADAQILACYPIMVQLRPHVKEEEFVARVRRQESQGYRLAFVREAGRVIAVVGFRTLESLAWGRVLYVDDLVTDETWRSRGVGRRLVDWVVSRAREEGCGEVHLDSGVQRLDAHRFYEREGFRWVANHFRIRLDGAKDRSAEPGRS
jgi:GNAT superfamily N-acetyltransferase